MIGHSYRIEQLTSLACPSQMLESSPSSSKIDLTESLWTPLLQHYSLALQLRGRFTPDTITAYISLDSIPLPLGLIPGVGVILYRFQLRQSRSGNLYCVHTPISALEMTTVNEQQVRKKTDGSPGVCLTQGFDSMTTTSIISLVEAQLQGQLSRRVVYLRAVVVSVQKIVIELNCCSCQGIVLQGQCASACVRGRRALKTEAR